MGSLLAGGNKKDRVDQYKLVAKMRFYEFREVKFLFKTFMCAYSKSLALLFEAHTLTLDVGQKITNIQSTYHFFNTIILYFI
ncbi:hypothetical protein HpCOL116_14950 [Helicobacter pylori]